MREPSGSSGTRVVRNVIMASGQLSEAQIIKLSQRMLKPYK